MLHPHIVETGFWLCGLSLDDEAVRTAVGLQLGWSLYVPQNAFGISGLCAGTASKLQVDQPGTT